MGTSNSRLKVEGFTKEEISRLSKRFKKLDTDLSGAVSIAEFLTVPELKQVFNFYFLFNIEEVFRISFLMDLSM